MKRVLSVFLTLALILSMVMMGNTAVFAAYDGRGFTYTIANSTATITAYSGAGGAVTIPSTLGGAPVTSIGGSAFSNHTNLTSISIPQSVTSIGANAFLNCTGLTRISFNSATTTIYDSAATIPATTKIIGYDLSSAQVYATTYGRTFGTLVIHTVTFIADGTTIATKTIDDGATLIDIPVVPVKAGNTGVWNITSFTNITTDKTVTAVYTEYYTYTIG